MEFEKLNELALECGFSHCGPMEVSRLELREEVRDMCKTNSCGQYGKRWSCPPGCGELEELRAQIAPYLMQDEDVLSYALFPEVSKKFFEYRKAKKYNLDAENADAKLGVHAI